MQFIKKLGHIWVISIFMVGYLLLARNVAKLDFTGHKHLVMFVLAPLSEELLYRWIPYKLGERIKDRFNLDIIWILGILFNFLFISIHVNNFPYWGTYFAFMYQGMFGFISFYATTKYGYFASVALHIKWNLANQFL